MVEYRHVPLYRHYLVKGLVGCFFEMKQAGSFSTLRGLHLVLCFWKRCSHLFPPPAPWSSVSLALCHPKQRLQDAAGIHIIPLCWWKLTESSYVYLEAITFASLESKRYKRSKPEVGIGRILPSPIHCGTRPTSRSRDNR